MNKLTPHGSIFDHFFNEAAPGFFIRPLHGDGLPDAGQIKIEVSEQDDAFAVTAEIPGVAKEDIDVSVEDAVVTIRAEIKQHDAHKEGDKVLRSERYYGVVSRSFQLPARVSAGSAKATYDNGVLRLTLPKQKEEQGTKVMIE
ncbi:MAG: heat-shock protein Hsp20 [Gammaproteobacteria bacterium]|nr:MAG: heat-shock protein Hsp20 [Gammaproteobacteria bacterium]